MKIFTKIFYNKKRVFFSLFVFVVIGVLLMWRVSPVVQAAVTVDTSTSNSPTSYGFQRKTWHDGSRFWVAFYSGSQIEFWYSADGSSWTQNTSATLAINDYDFSIEADSTNLFIAYVNGINIEARKASSYPGTGFSWGSPTTVFTPGINEICLESTIERDSNNKVRINTVLLNDTLGTSELSTKLSTSANDITAFSSSSTLSTGGNAFGHSLAALAGGDMYAVWVEGLDVLGKKNTAGTWDTSATVIVSAGVTSGENNIQMIGNPTTDEAYLLYINSSNQTIFKKYIDGTGWQTSVTLDSNSGNNYSTISVDTGNNNLYAFWIRSNTIYYKKGISPYASTEWDTNPTTLINTGTNNYLSSAYQNGPNKIFLEWTEGTASPYNVKWESVNIVVNTAPAAPTLSLPAANANGAAVNPRFELSTTDADGDYLKYKIDVCSTSNCSAVVRTIDQTSSQTGWAGQDQQSATAYTGAVLIGNSKTAVHFYQMPALNPNTQYWWRAYAIDPAGTNTFSAPSTIATFTTAAQEVKIQGGVEIRGGTKIGS